MINICYLSGTHLFESPKMIYNLVKNHKNWIGRYNFLQNINVYQMNLLCHYVAMFLSRDDSAILEGMMSNIIVANDTNLVFLMHNVLSKMSKRNFFAFLKGLSMSLGYIMREDSVRFLILNESLKYFRVAEPSEIAGIITTLGTASRDPMILSEIDEIMSSKGDEGKLIIVKSFMNGDKVPQDDFTRQMETILMMQDPSYLFAKGPRFARDNGAILQLFRNSDSVSDQALNNIDLVRVVKDQDLMRNLFQIHGFATKICSTYREVFPMDMDLTLLKGVIAFILHPENANSFLYVHGEVHYRFTDGTLSRFHMSGLVSF